MSRRREHRIRLAGPWQWSGWGTETITVKLPVESCTGLPHPPGASLWTRRFHAPTGLAESDQVLIEIPSDWGRVKLRLDDSLLPEEHRRWKLTGKLKGSHLLQIQTGDDWTFPMELPAPQLVIIPGGNPSTPGD